MNNIKFASNVINIDTCNCESNLEIEQIKYLINLYLFIYFEARFDNSV
jgi:hypothetical protein